MTNEQLVEMLARAIAIHSYHDNGLETMSYSGEAAFADRESHHYVGEAQACVDALAPMIGEAVEALNEIAYGNNTITEADCADEAKKALASLECWRSHAKS